MLRRKRGKEGLQRQREEKLGIFSGEGFWGWEASTLAQGKERGGSIAARGGISE